MTHVNYYLSCWSSVLLTLCGLVGRYLCSSYKATWRCNHLFRCENLKYRTTHYTFQFIILLYALLPGIYLRMDVGAINLKEKCHTVRRYVSAEYLVKQ
jgi:hypothetical protein